MSSKAWTILALAVPMLGIAALLRGCEPVRVWVDVDLSGSEIKAIEMTQKD